MANDGHVDNVNVAGNDSYSANGGTENIQNSNMMIQWHGEYQHQGRGPYGYNQASYPGAPSNMLYVQPDYTYPNPPPATDMDMNMNGYNDGYYFNEYDGYYYFYHPPTNGFYPLQPQSQFQVQPQPVFDAGRRGSSSSRRKGKAGRRRSSTGRNNNNLQAKGRGGGRGRGRVFRDNNYNNNTSLPQVMGNIGELLIRLGINKSESSTELEGQGRVERDEHANAAVVSREYSNAKFFVIKSYSRENVVSSIKHKVWTSTCRGNRKLNAAFREARHRHSVNAIVLFFSVEGSRNFCGVAEMDGPVDFDAFADCWDRDWKGKFPVQWHAVKDVPYSHFQHITFNTVENPNQMSIINSRDTQEVEYKQGAEMLDIFNKYVSTASLLDDISTSTASVEQQQSQPPSLVRQQQQEQPEGRKKRRKFVESPRKSEAVYLI